MTDPYKIPNANLSSPYQKTNSLIRVFIGVLIAPILIYFFCMFLVGILNDFLYEIDIDAEIVFIIDVSISTLLTMLAIFIAISIGKSKPYLIAILGSIIYLYWYTPLIFNKESITWYSYLTVLKTPVSAILSAYLFKKHLEKI